MVIVAMLPAHMHYVSKPCVCVYVQPVCRRVCMCVRVCVCVESEA